MQKRLNEIFNGEDVKKLDQSVIYAGVVDHVHELSREEFEQVLPLVSPNGRLILMKKRCDHGDKNACLAIKVAVEGDPSAPYGTPKNLGLRGLWTQ